MHEVLSRAMEPGDKLVVRTLTWDPNQAARGEEPIVIQSETTDDERQALRLAHQLVNSALHHSDFRNLALEIRVEKPDGTFR